MEQNWVDSGPCQTARVNYSSSFAQLMLRPHCALQTCNVARTQSATSKRVASKIRVDQIFCPWLIKHGGKSGFSLSNSVLVCDIEKSRMEQREKRGETISNWSAVNVQERGNLQSIKCFEICWLLFSIYFPHAHDPENTAPWFFHLSYLRYLASCVNTTLESKMSSVIVVVNIGGTWWYKEVKEVKWRHPLCRP